VAAACTNALAAAAELIRPRSRAAATSDMKAACAVAAAASCCRRRTVVSAGEVSFSGGPILWPHSPSVAQQQQLQLV
jgi:hypothetical protein